MFITRRFDESSKCYVFFNTRTHRIVNNPWLTELYIPPAYTNVVISENPNNKVLAIGEDSKGRKQYIYNKDYIQEQKELKFSDLKVFGSKLKRIRRDYMSHIVSYSNSKKCLNKLLSLEYQIALALFLLDRCNFRVGNQKYKDLYKSYGVTTLNSTHILLNKNNIRIRFIGKKGVENTSLISNKYVMIFLRDLKLINESREYLFSYRDSKGIFYRLTEKHINSHLKKYDSSLSVKMFRTWNANYNLLRELLNLEYPVSQKQTKKNIRVAIMKSAKALHHTSNVSKKSYMSNEILEMYQNDPEKFYKLLMKFKKSNGELPTIDRLLALLLKAVN